MNDLVVHVLLFVLVSAAIVLLGSFHAEAEDRRALRGYPRRLLVFLFGSAVLAGMGALSGASTIVLPESIKFDPSLVLRLIEKERVINVANVPTGWKKLVSCPEAEKRDLSSVRVTTTGGGLCTVPLKKKILEVFPNAMILDAFGQTEMTPVTSILNNVAPSAAKLPPMPVPRSRADGSQVWPPSRERCW